MHAGRSHAVAIVAALLAFAFPVVLACGQAAALRGNVVVDGSSTVYPVTEAAAAAFGKEFPNVKVTVAVSGTGGGFKRFVTGEIDVANASRPIRAEEFEKARANAVRFVELPIALDGLSVVVSPENDWAQHLTIAQLKAIYLEGGSARRWSDLDPSWPDRRIKVYSPGTDSGTFDYFKEVVVGEGESFRSDMSASEDDNVLVTGVAGDRDAIGYFGAAYYYENRGKLRAVPIVNPSTGQAVLPDPEHVISGAYAPLSRPLFVYVNAASLRRPAVRRFVEFYLSGAAGFAERVRYVALPEEVAATAAELLGTRTTGTACLTPDLRKREGGLPEVYTREHLTDTQ